ncbi:formylmethanofuran dehydrogenase subunit C [Bradyrhizobium diazoefficiens]
MGASPVAVVIIMDGAEAVGITMAGGTIIIIGKLDSMIQAAQ